MFMENNRSGLFKTVSVEGHWSSDRVPRRPAWELHEIISCLSIQVALITGKNKQTKTLIEGNL